MRLPGLAVVLMASLFENILMLGRKWDTLRSALVFPSGRAEKRETTGVEDLNIIQL